MQKIPAIFVRNVRIISLYSNMVQINTWLFMRKLSYSVSKTTTFYSTISDHRTDQTLFQKSQQNIEMIPYWNVNECTKMITSLVRHGRLKDALQVFDEMPVRDTIAWNSIIKGCCDCDNLTKARKLFDEMGERNVVTWTTMINGYMRYGKVNVAEGLFREMPYKDVAAWNCMIYGYFTNNRVNEAVKLFEEMPCRNDISWTSMVSGFDQNGRSVDALRMFKQMVGYGVEPTISMFPSLITACANSGAFELGCQVHARVVKLGWSAEDYIASSFITFYANCKQPESSGKIFRENVHDNVVVWTSLLTGYSLNSKHHDALTVISDMIRMGIFPNESSFTSALNSCCALMSISAGQVVHAEAMKLGFEASAFVGNSLVTLYSKCGSIKDAIKAFERIEVKNIVSWNSVIAGSAQHGYAIWAFALFAQILRAGVESDEITLTGLLNAASHSGMFLRGRHFFRYFSKFTSIKMNVQHYSCVVDILCRSGELHEAEDFIKNMPIKAESLMLLNLLSACRTHSNIEMAERVSKHILDLDPHCSAAYTLLSNIYASAGRWSDVSRVRSQMIRGNTTKEEGFSWLNQQGKMHVHLS